MAPIVVLGMHKSGTTLVSLMLHRSGIAMVDCEEAGGYDEGNHFERMSANGVNKRLLGGNQGNSLRTFQRLDPNGVVADLKRDAANLVAELEDRGQRWGFKDPRTCLTYEFWREVLPPHQLICVYRSPGEVHAHYTRKRSLDPTRGIRALRAWYEYNRGMLDALRQAAPGTALLLDYARLMEDASELDRLSRFLGCDVRDVRDARLRRARPRIGLRIRLEAALLKLATGRDVFSLAKEISALLG